MKTTSLSLKSAALAAIALMTSVPAMGAVLWVDGVLAMPTTYTGTAPDFVSKITDQSNATAVTGITLAGADTLTLGWSTPFTNDGTGVIKITSTVNLFPMASGSGYDIRLLLEDDSYSNTYTVSASTGVKEIDFVIRAYVSRQTVLINDIYSGPLAVKGIEFTNLNPKVGGGNDPLSIRSVLAEVPPEVIPEPSATLLAAAGGLLLATRRRR
ncbi:MAG: hypothetical protein EOP88_13540 [Verrucomicrobiaceae bacterium]|nr:MAG: hypothetical protein EOP88_13540 [Verrucomicrobiaceae bacterium]